MKKKNNIAGKNIISKTAKSNIPDEVSFSFLMNNKLKELHIITQSSKILQCSNWIDINFIQRPLRIKFMILIFLYEILGNSTKWKENFSKIKYVQFISAIMLT